MCKPAVLCILTGERKAEGTASPSFTRDHSWQDVPSLCPTYNLGHIKPASGSPKEARLHLTAVVRSLTCSSFLCLRVSISLFQKGDPTKGEGCKNK